MALDKAIRVAIPTDVKTLDPHEADDAVTFEVLNQIYEGLTAFADDSIEIVPGLAESWTHSVEFKTWTFTLRKNLKFSDGSPVTGQAVLDSFARVKDLGGVVELEGENRVVFKLREANAHLAATLAQLYFPVLRQTPDGPIGTGPFAFEGRRAGRELVLVRNPHHRLHKPEVERVVFRVIPFMTLIPKGLKEGEVDLSAAVTPSMLPVLRNDSSIHLEFQMGLNTGFLCINCSRPPLDDVRLRTAIALAVDRAPLVQKFFPTGYGEPATTLLPPVYLKERSEAFHPVDLEKAQELVKQSSYDGAALRFCPSWAPRPYMPDPPAITTELVKMLRAIGLSLVEEPTPPIEEFFDRQGNGDYELMLSGWIADDTVAYNFLADNLASNRVGRTNVPRFSSASFDMLLTRLRRSTGADADALIKQAEDLVRREVPLVPLFHGPQIAASGQRIRGSIIHPSGLLRVWSVRLS